MIFLRAPSLRSGNECHGKPHLNQKGPYSLIQTKVWKENTRSIFWVAEAPYSFLAFWALMRVRGIYAPAYYPTSLCFLFMHSYWSYLQSGRESMRALFRFTNRALPSEVPSDSVDLIKSVSWWAALKKEKGHLINVSFSIFKLCLFVYRSISPKEVIKIDK